MICTMRELMDEFRARLKCGALLNWFHPGEDRCDSPIEVDILQFVRKWLDHDACELKQQFPCSTRWRRFRADFALISVHRTIIVECDGRQFHDIDRDSLRDAMILGSGLATDIVRFRGQDIHYSLAECVYSLMRWYPSIFRIGSAEGIENIVDRVVSASDFRTLDASTTLSTGHSFHAIRSTNCDRFGDQYWMSLFRFAKKHYELDFEELVEAIATRGVIA